MDDFIVKDDEADEAYEEEDSVVSDSDGEEVALSDDGAGSSKRRKKTAKTVGADKKKPAGAPPTSSNKGKGKQQPAKVRVWSALLRLLQEVDLLQQGAPLLTRVEGAPHRPTLRQRGEDASSFWVPVHCIGNTH